MEDNLKSAITSPTTFLQTTTKDICTVTFKPSTNKGVYFAIEAKSIIIILSNYSLLTEKLGRW